MDIDSILGHWRDGEATASEIADAAAQLNGPEGPRLLDNLRIEALLASRRPDAAAACLARVRAVLTQGRSSVHRRAVAGVRLRVRQRRFLRWSALAAVILLAIGLGWLNTRRTAPLLDGRPLMGEAITLADGASGVLTWPDGSRVELAGPAQAEVANAQLHLIRGSLSAEIAPQGSGRFAISTPHGEAAVLGTRFRVLTGDATAVLVDEGRVAFAGREITAGGVALAGPGVPAPEATPSVPPAWLDRRPIAVTRLHMVAPTPGNPGGWLMDADVDLGPDPAAELARLLPARAEADVQRLASYHVQGVVVWDAFAHNQGGLPMVAADGAAGIDALMARYRAAGLRVGCGVEWVGADTINGVVPDLDADEVAARLALHIAFAKARWGATLFFLLDFRSEEALSRLRTLQPDVLLMPIGDDDRQHRWGAPLQWYAGMSGTSDEARRQLPGAFSAVTLDAERTPTETARLVANLELGDIALFQAHWLNPEIVPLLQRWRR